MKLRIFADESHYTPDAKFSLTDIIRPFWVEKLRIDRGLGAGHFERWFELVPDIEDADICLLPLFWHYYLKAGRRSQALQAADAAARAGKRIVIYALGDNEYRVPVPNALLIGTSLRRSRREPFQFALPSFFGDYAARYASGQLTFRDKGSKPVVGFCGQGSIRPDRLALWMGRNFWLRIRDLLYRLPYQPPPIVPHIVLRARLLHTLANHNAVEARFLVRSNYLGGVSGPERKDPYHPIKLEFVSNILNTDYTLCVRGSGNYSMRLYETLCLGRIPIFVDTDSVLPYDFAIDWKQYCVWVEQHEMCHIAEKVADFHSQLTPTAFVDLQHECRKLWETRLAGEGFYAHFREHLATLDGLSGEDRHVKCNPSGQFV